MEECITKNACSLNEALGVIFPESSKRTLSNLLKAERVSVDGFTETTGNSPLLQGQLVRVGPLNTLLCPKLELLYKDHDIAVVHKKAGLLSVATNSEKEESVHGILKRQFSPHRVYPVHRLDRETSGLLLFAVSEPSCKALKEMFMDHRVQREYFAIVEGVIEEDTGTWESFLQEDENYYVYSHPSEGQWAQTHFKRVWVEQRWTALEIRLSTGRKNQIRVHCQEAKHPVLGDKKYGAQSNPLGRMALHAKLLRFTHPINGKVMKFEVPLPKVFKRILGKFRNV